MFVKQLQEVRDTATDFASALLADRREAEHEAATEAAAEEAAARDEFNATVREKAVDFPAAFKAKLMDAADIPHQDICMLFELDPRGLGTTADYRPERTIVNIPNPDGDPYVAVEDTVYICSDIDRAVVNEDYRRMAAYIRELGLTPVIMEQWVIENKQYSVVCESTCSYTMPSGGTLRTAYMLSAWMPGRPAEEPRE